MRVVFFGTPEFAVPTFDALLTSAHTVTGVVTQPDRPRGRGQQTSDSPIKARANSAGLPVLQPERLKDASFVASLEGLRPDIGVVAAYGRILTETVLCVPRFGMVNVHASLLPKYRGAAPVHRAVMAGERQTGVTIMRVVKALDAGPMLASVGRAIGRDETSAEVERGLAISGATLLVETLDRLARGRIDEVPQNDEEATYAPRITREDGTIDWGNAATAIHNQIRGLYPWPHAYSFVEGQRIIFWSATPLETASDAAPGTVVDAVPGRLHIATASGTLAVTMLQAEGRRPLPIREFLAGHPLAAGVHFGAQP